MLNLNNLFKFDLKKKIILSMAIFLLIILGLLLFVVIPTVRDIKNMSREIEEQRLDLEKKYIKGQSLKQLAENLKMIEPELVKLDKIFINQPSFYLSTLIFKYYFILCIFKNSCKPKQNFVISLLGFLKNLFVISP